MVGSKAVTAELDEPVNDGQMESPKINWAEHDIIVYSEVSSGI